MQLFTSSREYHVRQLQNDDSYGKGKAAVSMPDVCWAAKYPVQGLKMEALWRDHLVLSLAWLMALGC